MTELNTVVVIVVTFSAGFASAVTFASAVASVFAIGFSFAAAITAAVALYFGFPSFYTSGDDSSIYSAAVNSAFANAANVSVGSGFAVAFTSTLLGIYCSHRALEGDEKFSLIRTISVAFGAIGGTSFRGADLTYANFSKALLKSTNFTNIWERGAQGKRRKCETLLDWVRWQDAQKLDRARVGNSILSTPAARELLVTPNGYKKSYVNVKL